MKVYTVKGTTDEVTTCELCGRVELKGTVVLIPLDEDGNPDGDECYFGTSCAAKAAGWTQREVTKKITAAKKEAKEAAQTAARAAFWKARREETAAYEAWLKKTYPTGSPVKEYGVAALWAQFRASLTESPATLASRPTEEPAVSSDPVKPLKIEPRGTVYGTSTHRQWSRVINGTVFHFELIGPSAYWRKGPSVRVTRHPYGQYRKSAVAHSWTELAAYVDNMEDGRPCKGDRGHFLGQCGTCDARRLSRMTPDAAERWYRSGHLSQAQLEAFMYAWATSCVRYTAGGWSVEPTDPEVLAIAAEIRSMANLATPSPGVV